MNYANPESRNEKILAKALKKYSGAMEEPQSRIEELCDLLQSDSGAVPDWDISNASTEGFIKNKPSIRSGRGKNSIVEGSAEGANGDNSHAEGLNCGTMAASSHAEGSDSRTFSEFSHAEGQHTIAGGIACHVEGYNTNAAGISAHAEGDSTAAGGASSHAEGNGSRTNGAYSHAEGTYTIADGENQHVFGKYNVRDRRAAFIEVVGNGNSDEKRSNARTLDWKESRLLGLGNSERRSI